MTFHPILVGDELKHELYIPICDWNYKFQGDINHLISFNHFELNYQEPGMLYCKKFITDDQISNQLLNANLPHDFCELPRNVETLGLTPGRKKYLRENILEFVPDAFKDLLCPPLTNEEELQDAIVNQGKYTLIQEVAPAEVTPKRLSGTKRSSTNPSASNSKRKRAAPPKCSYCQVVGHLERIFGKITCPLKKKELNERKSDESQNIDLNVVEEVIENQELNGNQQQEIVISKLEDTQEILVSIEPNINQ